MDIIEITEAIEALLDEQYEAGFEDGHTAGLEELDQQFQAGHDEGFVEGATAERERIKSVLKMMLEFAMQNNKMAEAKGWKMALDIVEPIEVDYSEEAYKRSLEQDGF